MLNSYVLFPRISSARELCRESANIAHCPAGNTAKHCKT